ncbi:MAG: carbohydrate ABC transporter permease [Anaerolineaceae bacterium]|nr:carbohydrate ABC transporter permease [Anaerolineaceae bacterium]
MRQNKSTQIFRYVLLISFSMLVFLPITGLLLNAFRSPLELNLNPFSLPSTLSLENIQNAWTVGRFGIFFKNSLIVALIVVSVSVLLSVFSGYAFALLPMPGKKWLYPLVLIGYMVPFEAAIIPLFNLMDSMDLRDTYWALILPQIGLSVSFGTLWMASYFETIPQELIDSAVMDGSNRWQTLWKLVVPLSKPSLTTLIVLIFMWTWNEFLLALVMIQDEGMRTLPVALAFFQGRYTSNVPLLAAGALVVALPTVLVYVLFQRFFIRGMLGGAVKG